MSEEINKLFTGQKPLRGVIEWLAQKFPGCFVTNYPRKPLKIGIHQDLIAIGFTPRQARKTLGYYVVGERYHESLIAGAARYNLNGEVDGFVTEAAAQYAQEYLAKVQADREEEFAKVTAAYHAKREAKEAKAPKARKTRQAAAKPEPPKLDGLSGLKVAALARRASAA